MGTQTDVTSACSQGMLGLCCAVGIDPACSFESEAILDFYHSFTNELLVKKGHPIQLRQKRERNIKRGPPLSPSLFNIHHSIRTTMSLLKNP